MIEYRTIKDYPVKAFGIEFTVKKGISFDYRGNQTAILNCYADKQLLSREYIQTHNLYRSGITIEIGDKDIEEYFERIYYWKRR